MRIVDNLDAISCCSHCGSSELYLIKNCKDNTQHKYCIVCDEEFYESDKTKANEEKEKLIWELREDIHELQHFAKDQHSCEMLDAIRCILSRIVDYIENN
jgi:hypothetical protein